MKEDYNALIVKKVMLKKMQLGGVRYIEDSRKMGAK